MRDFVKARLWVYIVSILAIVAAQFVLVQFPHILGQFFHQLHLGGLTPAGVAGYGLKLSAVALAYWILFGVGQFQVGRLARTFEYELRDRLFQHWEKLSANYFRTHTIGDLLNHSMNDVRTLREAMAQASFLASAVFLLIATLYMAVSTVSVTLTAVALLPILLIPAAVVWWGPRIREASRLVQESLSAMAEFTEESLSAIRLVKATANESIELERFSDRVESIADRQIATVKRTAMFQSLIPLMGSLSFAVALSYGGFLAMDRSIGLGAFIAFTLYLSMLIAPLQRIGFVVNTFQRASASFHRVDVLFRAAPDIADPDVPAELGRVSGRLEIRLPEYSYPGSERPALRGIEVAVEPGWTLGIVGRTGSGKSTLANLLVRAVDPPPGTVFLDGVDIRDLRLRDLREAVAYVPQDGFLFSSTIAENIGFSREGVPADSLLRAARDAAVYEDIARFRDGLKTQIGERGVTLSGGQKQRVALARAYLKDAPLLIADDSLSAVDTRTEAAILERMRETRKGKTTVIIAHRLSAVAHADWILVLEDGRVREQGTHAQLLAKGGLYARVHALQQAEEGTG